jgi:hypothetical protein
MSDIRIYKNQFDENERVQYSELFKQLPDNIWTQSDCTDEEVKQLKHFMPSIIKFKLLKMHYYMMDTISKDFELEKYNIKLTHPGDQFLIMDNSLTIDKRIIGNSLGPHADVPTGTFAKEKGVFFEDGTSPITVSSVFYWNDDFEGGELELYFSINPKDLIENPQNYDFEKISPDYTYKPVAGDLVVFPSHVVHAIKPITKGTRYSTQYFYERVYNN